MLKKFFNLFRKKESLKPKDLSFIGDYEKTAQILLCDLPKGKKSPKVYGGDKVYDVRHELENLTEIGKEWVSHYWDVQKLTHKELYEKEIIGNYEKTAAIMIADNELVKKTDPKFRLHMGDKAYSPDDLIFELKGPTQTGKEMIESFWEGLRFFETGKVA